MLSKYRNGPRPNLIVDAGNLLFPSGIVHDSLLETKKNAADIIAQSFIAEKNALVSIGTLDLAAGTDFLLQLQQKHQFRFLSANILNRINGQPLFTPFISAPLAGLDIAVIGLIDHKTAPGNDKEITTVSWEEVLPDILKQVESAELVILLSNYPEEINRDIIDHSADIHIVIQSGKTGRNKKPELYKNALLCTTAGRGKYQGLLRVQWDQQADWGINSTSQADQAGSGSSFHNRIIPITAGLPEDRSTRLLIRKLK